MGIGCYACLLIQYFPDTGDSYGINPVSAFIWNRLDGQHTIQDIHQDLLSCCEEVPDNAADDIETFVNELLQKGYAGRQWDGSN